jgi:hypothetical protein
MFSPNGKFYEYGISPMFPIVEIILHAKIFSLSGLLSWDIGWRGFGHLPVQ